MDGMIVSSQMEYIIAKQYMRTNSSMCTYVINNVREAVSLCDLIQNVLDIESGPSPMVVVDVLSHNHSD